MTLQAEEPAMAAPPNIVNVEAARAWDGESEHRVQYAARYDDGVRAQTRWLLEAAAIAAGERPIDVGCGCGGSTLDAARQAASGLVLGVDLSARMINRARERGLARGITNASFEQADVQVQPFEDGAFDLAISRYGATFFGDRVAAFRNINRALRPGGRLAILSWQPLSLNA